MTKNKAPKNKGLQAKRPISEAEKTKRSRVRYACKPALQSLFNVVNLIPPDQEMECPYVQGLIPVRPGSQKWIEKENQKYEAFKEYLKNFPVAFQAYIFYSTSDEMNRVFRELDERAQDMSEADELVIWNKLIGIQSKEISLYERIRAIRNDLYLLAEIGQSIDKYLGQQLDIALGVLLVEYAYLDKEGRIRRQSNPYAEMMEGVEASRIRACLICRKLFWASRKDKKCCSEEHSAIIRQRQSRLNKEKNAKLYAQSAKLRKHGQKVKPVSKESESYKQKGE